MYKNKSSPHYHRPVRYNHSNMQATYALPDLFSNKLKVIFCLSIRYINISIPSPPHPPPPYHHQHQQQKEVLRQLRPSDQTYLLLFCNNFDRILPLTIHKSMIEVIRLQIVHFIILKKKEEAMKEVGGLQLVLSA